MRYIVYILCLYLVLGCSSQKSVDNESTLPVEAPKNINIEQPTKKSFSYGYEKALDSISTRVSSDKEFVRCMDQSVNSCISSSVMLLARNAKDVKLCDELIDTGIRNACKQAITSLNARDQKNLKLCDTLLEGKVGCRAEIITLLAREKKDLDVCNDLITQTGSMANSQESVAQGDCMMQVIGHIGSLDTNLCEKISQELQRDMCKRNIEQRKRSYSNTTGGRTSSAPTIQ